MATYSCLLVLCLLLVTNDVISQTADDVKNLMTNIFVTNSYNKLVRPITNQTHVLVVSLDFSLIGISDVDEVTEKLTTAAFLELHWSDVFFLWNTTDYNNVKELYIPQKDLWRPDIALDNGFAKMKELGDNFLLMTAKNDGTMEWSPFEVFETKCSINIENFPFDSQICDITFGVWTSPLEAIDVDLGKNGIRLKHYQENGEWDLVHTSSKSAESKWAGATVTFTLTVKRRPDYYIFNVIIPILLLSILAVFTFVIPVDSGEKMGFCMTVYLAFAVFLTIVSQSLPISSNQSLLSKYLLFLVIIGTLIISVTTLELRLHYRHPSREVSDFLKGLVRLSWRLQCRKSYKKVGHENNNSVQDLKKINGDVVKESTYPPEVTYDDRISWPDVVAAIDLYSFCTFIFMDVIGITVFFGVASSI